MYFSNITTHDVGHSVEMNVDMEDLKMLRPRWYEEFREAIAHLEALHNEYERAQEEVA